MVYVISLQEVWIITVRIMDYSSHPFTEVSSSTRQRVFKKLNSIRYLCALQEVMASNVEDMLMMLRRQEYSASLSSGNSQVFMVLTRDTDTCGHPCRCIFASWHSPGVRAVFVCAASRMFFDAALFEQDTVLLGELVKSADGSISFLADDLIVLNGVILIDSHTIHDRHSTIVNILHQGHRQDPLFASVQMVIKSLCQPHDVSPLIKLANQLPYTSRFLTLRPVMGRCHVFQIRIESPRTERPANTISDINTSTLSTPPPHPVYPDVLNTAREHNTGRRKMLLIRRTDLPDVYEVSEGKGQMWNIACLPTLAASQYVAEMFHNTPQSACVWLECTFNVAFNKWEPNTGPK